MDGPDARLTAGPSAAISHGRFEVHQPCFTGDFEDERPLGGRRYGTKGPLRPHGWCIRAIPEMSAECGAASARGFARLDLWPARSLAIFFWLLYDGCGAPRLVLTADWTATEHGPSGPLNHDVPGDAVGDVATTVEATVTALAGQLNLSMFLLHLLAKEQGATNDAEVQSKAREISQELSLRLPE